jgi:putative phosphoribosyl transferase
MGATTRTAPFRDRREAGRVLAKDPLLRRHRERDDATVLALPRGGVPVGYEIAKALRLPLDVFVVRKLGVPGHEELAMGAIAGGGTRVVEQRVVRRLELDEDTIAAVAASERKELEKRERLYRGARPPLDVRGRSAILVDDGLATGSTMRAAVRALRIHEPEEIVVAVPVAPRETCAAMEEEADEVVCALIPEFFGAVGLAYERFGQTSDDEVIELLRDSQPRTKPAQTSSTTVARQRSPARSSERR